MALNSVSSKEFSFPALASHDSSHHSGLDSPPLWKHSPENSRREDHDRGFARLIIGKHGDKYNDQTKSFSYVETRSRWSDQAEEKMDLLWEDLNEELTTRSQSLRIDPGGDGGEKKPSVVSDESSAVTVECGLKLTKKTALKKKKMNSSNVLVMMRVFKKLLVLRSSSHRSPAKTHPRCLSPS